MYFICGHSGQCSSMVPNSFKSPIKPWFLGCLWEWEGINYTPIHLYFVWCCADVTKKKSRDKDFPNVARRSWRQEEQNHNPEPLRRVRAFRPRGPLDQPGSNGPMMTQGFDHNRWYTHTPNIYTEYTHVISCYDTYIYILNIYHIIFI